MNGSIRWREFTTSLFILAVGVIYLIWARTYPSDMNAVPTLVAWLTIILASIDATSHTETRIGAAIRRFVGQTSAEASSGDEKSVTPGWLPVIFSILWPLAYVVAVIVAGFLLATPVYIVLYMTMFGRKPLLMSTLTALITTAAIWIVFELLFHYPLFPGVLFGGIF